MIAEGLTRQGINKRVVRLRRMFSGGRRAGIGAPVEVLHGIAKPGTPRPRPNQAPEAKPIEPVPQDHVDAVMDNVPEPVAAMVELQMLTAMRPGEVVAMRRATWTPSGKVWIYRPPSHKNTWRGQRREISLGPKAIEISKLVAPRSGGSRIQPAAILRRNQYLDRYTAASTAPPSSRAAGRPASPPGDRVPCDITPHPSSRPAMGSTPPGPSAGTSSPTPRRSTPSVTGRRLSGLQWRWVSPLT